MTMTKILEIEAMSTRLTNHSRDLNDIWPNEANMLLRSAAEIIDVAAIIARNKLEKSNAKTTDDD